VCSVDYHHSEDGENYQNNDDDAYQAEHPSFLDGRVVSTNDISLSVVEHVR
jgi:hypothetical protein